MIWDPCLPTKVYQCRFWMMLLGAPSSKPTEVYSNGSWIGGLNVGPLTKKFKEQYTRLQTTRLCLSNQETHGCHLYKYI